MFTLFLYCHGYLLCWPRFVVVHLGLGFLVLRLVGLVLPVTHPPWWNVLSLRPCATRFAASPVIGHPGALTWVLGDHRRQFRVLKPCRSGTRCSKANSAQAVLVGLELLRRSGPRPSGHPQSRCSGSCPSGTSPLVWALLGAVGALSPVHFSSGSRPVLVEGGLFLHPCPHLPWCLWSQRSYEPLLWHRPHAPKGYAEVPAGNPVVTSGPCRRRGSQLTG